MMNLVALGGTDWNDAAEAYNTRRAQIKDEVVAYVSAYFGFELTLTFPYYQGDEASIYKKGSSFTENFYKTRLGRPYWVPSVNERKWKIMPEECK